MEGSDVLALVDADGDVCRPSKETLNNRNYRILLGVVTQDRCRSKMDGTTLFAYRTSACHGALVVGGSCAESVRPRIPPTSSTHFFFAGYFSCNSTSHLDDCMQQSRFAVTHPVGASQLQFQMKLGTGQG